jgi:hypothetical protein
MNGFYFPSRYTRAKVFVLAIAMALAGCSHLVQLNLESHRPDTRTQALLIGLRAEMQTAMIRGDRAKLEQLLDESFVFVHSTGKLESRPAFIDRMMVASASARRGSPLAFVGTDVLVKGESGWRWVSVQSTRIEH